MNGGGVLILGLAPASSSIRPTGSTDGSLCHIESLFSLSFNLSLLIFPLLLSRSHNSFVVLQSDCLVIRG